MARLVGLGRFLALSVPFVLAFFSLLPNINCFIGNLSFISVRLSVSQSGNRSVGRSLSQSVNESVISSVSLPLSLPPSPPLFYPFPSHSTGFAFSRSVTRRVSVWEQPAHSRKNAFFLLHSASPPSPIEGGRSCVECVTTSRPSRSAVCALTRLRHTKPHGRTFR